MLVALCTVVMLLAVTAPSLAQGSGGSNLASPCPGVFGYAPPWPESGLWVGVVTLSTEYLLHSVWLEIVLDSPAQDFGQLWHWVGNTITQDKIKFRIENDYLQIQPDHPMTVRFFVRYDPLNTAPKLRMLSLNGKVICNDGSHHRATENRPALSNVKQSSSRYSGPKIRTNLSTKLLKPPPSDTYSVNPEPGNISIAAIIPENNSPNTPATFETVECSVVSEDNEGVTLSYKGMNYTRGDIPWLTAIYSKGKESLRFICGGTLVSDRHVITAANCMLRRGAHTAIKDIIVKVGAHFLNDWSEDFVVFRELVAVSLHEDYDPLTLENNILMLSLKKPVKFNNYIRPACLWSGNTEPELSQVVGAFGVVAGWGVQSEEGTGQHNDPHKVLAPIVSTRHCRASKPSFNQLSFNNTFCAGARNGVGPCVGDSGAGLYLQEGGRWRLRGIVSLNLHSDDGSSDCNLNEYIVYTDTAQYLTWIKNVLSVKYISIR